MTTAIGKRGRQAAWRFARRVEASIPRGADTRRATTKIRRLFERETERLTADEVGELLAAIRQFQDDRPGSRFAELSRAYGLRWRA